MKKLLVFFMVLFGISLGAMAEDWPQDLQAGVLPNDCGANWVGDGFREFAVFFDTGVNTSSCDFSSWKTFLAEHKSDIGAIMVYGSADRQRKDGKPDKNIILSRERAEWTIDNIVPASFRSYCNFGEPQSAECQVHAMGESDDYAHSSDGGKRDSNPSARAAHVYVIWRLAQCPDKFVQNLDKYEQELKDALGKYPNDKVKIQNALDGVHWAQKTCKLGRGLYASESEQLMDVYDLLIIAGGVVPEVNITNTYVGISSLQVENSIDLQYSKLDNLRREFGLSIWRDENGNFNTARLVSDSIAGVVLGTVGGIVTSKLVKKNQLKKGFEDIGCYVGGQSVAGYGDEFNVGR